MTAHFQSHSAMAFTLVLLALGGCASGGGAPHSVGDVKAPASTSASWVGREEVGHAIELLNKGQEDQARKVLAKVLEVQPKDPIAGGLARQIDQDPVALLGQDSFAYTVKPGDTLSDLAGRFLGNPTSFYALGRYNRLTFPVTLEAGQTLRIPGEMKVAKKPLAPDKPRLASPGATPARPAPKAESARAAAPPADPKRATQLRAAALEQLNRGQVAGAVALLRQADAASPGNPLVERDLARALRIQRTLRP